MYHFIYSRPLWLIAAAIIAAVFLWGFLASRKLRYWRFVNAVLFLFSLLAVFCITLLRRTGSDSELCLIPFHALVEARHQPELYREMLMNILLFVPLGLTVPHILPRKWNTAARIICTALIALLLSAAVEYLQYSRTFGTAEVDDVICNTFGAVFSASHVFIANIITKHRSK